LFENAGILKIIYLLHYNDKPTKQSSSTTTTNMQPWWFAFIYCPILAFVLIALFCVSCREPGLMERVTDEEVAEQGWFWNEQVGSYRPAGAMYCREGKVSLLEF
jgi:hypothetical protein